MLLPHHCEATRRAITRSLIFGSQARWPSTSKPGPENSRNPPSGTCATVIAGSSGSGPKRSENTFIERATAFATSPALADAAGGAYTLTVSPADCFGVSFIGPATNEPFGAALAQSKT